MSTADLIMLLAFLGFVLGGLAVQTLLQMRRKSARNRVREQLKQTLHSSADPARRQVLADLQRAQADARRRRRRQSLGTLGYYLNRLDTISGGPGGVRVLIGVGIGTLVLMALGFALGLLPQVPLIIVAGVLLGPPLAMLVVYRKLLERFRNRFLGQLPDAIDVIVRASQAGIPAARSIRTVGERFEAPLGPEFRRMGDSLLLGSDMQEVLDDAVLRIEMPDFSFFAVCLLLQRETGGSLSETLENLSAIIRSRRDLRLKTRALTAEGRTAGALLAALPFAISGALMLLNPEYIGVMFEHPTGRMLLWVAGVMLVIGITMIRKISRMEV